jgi:hypothetical protein
MHTTVDEVTRSLTSRPIDRRSKAPAGAVCWSRRTRPGVQVHGRAVVGGVAAINGWVRTGQPRQLTPPEDAVQVATAGIPVG